MDAMTTMGDFINHLRERIMQLDTIEGPEALHRWTGEVGEELDRFAGGDWQVSEEPYAEVSAGPGRRVLSKWQLGTEHVGGQLSLYTLDAAIQPASTIALSGIGAIPVNVQISVVIGSTRDHDMRQGPKPSPEVPVLGQFVFQANVHCPQCQSFAAHGVYVPSMWDGYVLRRCTCTNHWRQYTAAR